MMPSSESGAGSDRVVAIRLLSAWVRKGTPPPEQALWATAGPLAREITLTSLRHLRLLDAWIDHLSREPPGKRVRPFLWVGFTQLLLLDGIPDHAAANETLKVAKREHLPAGQIRFLNALFRKAAADREALLSWRDQQSTGIQTSHPEFLIRRWEAEFGEEETRRMCIWNQQRSRTIARVTQQGLEKGLDRDLDDSYERHPADDRFVVLPRGVNPQTLPGFDDGGWYVQDPSTRLAPELLQASAGERILDACAAPGGKTGLLLDAMGRDTQTLWAADPDPHRVERLKENLDRLGGSAVEVVVADPRKLRETYRDFFDGILLDVPCSNTGVLQRRPDVTWRLEPGSFSERARLQSRLLEEAVPLLAPGGRLVYSTCCMEPEETTQLIQTWLVRHPGWELEAEERCLPGSAETDGAYACRLRHPG